MAHSWPFEENLICCQKYYDFFVKGHKKIDIKEFVKLLHEVLPEIKEGSLRMKVQNIKYILKELKISDTLCTAGISNYSTDNLNAMKKVLSDNNLLSRINIKSGDCNEP